MGLSNEERLKGIYFCIDSIVKAGKELSLQTTDLYRKDTEQLYKMSEQLWHAFLHTETNGVHWLLGSDSKGQFTSDSMSLFAVAIRSRLPRINTYKSLTLEERPEEPETDFNAFDDLLNIEGLLSHADNGWGTGYAYVFRIYQHLETLSYYLRRYNDDFLKRLEPLSIILSNMLGECFSIMSSEDSFAKAYELHNICIHLYINEFYSFDEKKDIIVQWLINQNMHHDICRPMRQSIPSGEDTIWLAKRHLELVKSKNTKEYPLTRLLVALKCAGRRYHYEHQHEDLINLLKKDTFFSQEKVISRVNLALKDCLKQHKIYEKEDHDNWQERHGQDELDAYRGY